jgi:hypothetical protein
MVDVLLRKRHRPRCYFCQQQADLRDAFYADICFWHQARISLRLLVLLARSGRFRGLRRVVRWKL